MFTGAEAYAIPLRVYALEVHAVQHCNLRCAGCAQLSPQMSPEQEDLGVLESALQNLCPLLECEKVQILGGEPLLHTELSSLLRVVSRSKIGKRITVKTNGLLLHRAQPDFWRLVDSVIVSVYPDTRRRLAQEREALEATALEHRAELIFRDIESFQHIHKDGPANEDDTTSSIYAACQYKKFTHSLRAGRVFRCAPSVNSARKRSDWYVADSIDVLNTIDLGRRLREFLVSAIPLQSCATCLGSSGSAFPHSIAPRAAK